MKRKVGEIFTYHFSSNKPRNIIRTEKGNMAYAIYVAQNNPEICGKWFEGCEVHHLDGNTLNDDPHNLICVDKLTHSKLHSKPVRAFLKGDYLGLFDSMLTCSESIGVPPSAISYYCNHNKPISSTFNDYRFLLV